jgi:hypothetical protein
LCAASSAQAISSASLRAAGFQGSLERGPNQVFQNQVVWANIVDLADVLVVERRDGACFLLKPRAMFTLDLLDGEKAV